MGAYRLTEDAKSDLKRIYARGLLEYGEEQADIYFNAFLTDSNSSQRNHFHIQPWTIFEPGTGAACAALTASITGFRAMEWKSWQLLGSRTWTSGFDQSLAFGH